ncbi:MAG TPA: glycosyltransferase [Gemmatimonadales bacterium]|nr:glycosyltransferase [Gemmatimonadales bacterium]
MLDISEYFGIGSGGIRTYLNAKSVWVTGHPEWRQCLVVPAREDAVVEGDGVRRYELAAPPIPGNAPYRFLYSVPATRRILRHERPDLIEIGSHLLAPWVTRAARRGLDIPCVWFYHGHLPRLVVPDRAVGALQRTAERIAWRYVRRLARGCRAVLVASPYLANELAEHGVENTVVVPLGVDLDHFHPRRRPAAGETRRRAGLPDAPLALFAGRLAREKQLDVVLDGWAAVERRTGARLAILGDGPRLAELQRHPYAARVAWLPFETDRERFADLLAAVDVYLAPGPYETFGLSALEAIASGTPVLSVDRGGVAERVEASGSGVLFPFNDPAGLAAAAISLFQSDLLALGVAGRRHAERHHGWDAAFTQLFTIYRQLLGRAG